MVHGRREQADSEMKVDKVMVRYGETANLGNYENVRPEVELAVTVPADKSAEDVVLDLIDQARTMVRAVVETAKNDRMGGK